MKERLATLISGGGTTMEQIILAAQAGKLPIEVVCVISSDPGAGGIEKARKLGIAKKNILVISPKQFSDKKGKVNQNKFGLALLKTLKEHRATVVTQNGWLPLTPENVIVEYQGKIFNQHPGPVPEFGGKGMYGRRVHAAVLLFRRMTKGEPWTEVVSQRVARDFDQGVVVKKSMVKILPTDTVEDLQQRALPVEHQLQINLLRDYTLGELKELKKESIVKPGEKRFLNLAKKIAALLYPHG